MNRTDDATRIDPTAVAKHIRWILSQFFPFQRFSVRTSKYSGGSSIDIHWTGGPEKAEVDTLVNHLRGATFDGMDDSMHYHQTPYNQRRLAGPTRHDGPGTPPGSSCVLYSTSSIFTSYIASTIFFFSR